MRRVSTIVVGGPRRRPFLIRRADTSNSRYLGDNRHRLFRSLVQRCCRRRLSDDRSPPSFFARCCDDVGLSRASASDHSLVRLSRLKGCESITMSMSVFLFVRSRNSKAARSNFVKFLCNLSVAMARSLVMYFRFCGWRHVFIPWGQWARIKHDVTFRTISTGGATSWTSDSYSVWSCSSDCGTGAKSAIHNWLVSVSYLEYEEATYPSLLLWHSSDLENNRWEQYCALPVSAKAGSHTMNSVDNRSEYKHGELLNITRRGKCRLYNLQNTPNWALWNIHCGWRRTDAVTPFTLCTDPPFVFVWPSSVVTDTL